MTAGPTATQSPPSTEASANGAGATERAPKKRSAFGSPTENAEGESFTVGESEPEGP